jgi:hypothetical protein
VSFLITFVKGEIHATFYMYSSNPFFFETQKEGVKNGMPSLQA